MLEVIDASKNATKPYSAGLPAPSYALNHLGVAPDPGRVGSCTLLMVSGWPWVARPKARTAPPPFWAVRTSHLISSRSTERPKNGL